MSATLGRSATLLFASLVVVGGCMLIAPLDDVTVAPAGSKPASCSDGLADNDETDVDCGGLQCDPCSAGAACRAGTDCVTAVCTAGRCAEATCGDMVHNGDETGLDCGGSCATKCKVGDRCNELEDCQSLVCTTGACAAPACDDSTRNGSETDVDCGGSCSPCAQGQSCTANADCEGKRCNGGICAVSSCDDGLENGAETSEDCGGGTCPRCALQEPCGKSNDCETNLCINNRCAPTDCTNGFKDGTETDADCGGACPKCLPDKICLSGKDCDSGACVMSKCTPPPSCASGDLGAGYDCGGDYCCASPVVYGAGYARSFDGVRSMDSTNQATVADFQLDLFEITVGRFRKFVDGYPDTLPAPGAGANPNVSQSGWRADFDAQMPPTIADLRGLLKCNPTLQTWTDAPGPNEQSPINCITWFEAFAFCAWDKGRLPTEAEWNYAASGGAEQRLYPWSSPPSSDIIDAGYVEPGSTLSPVGSKPPGAARWSQLDMAGSAAEWTLDWFGAYPLPCINCAALEQTPGLGRVVRGGSAFTASNTEFQTAFRGEHPPDGRFVGVGVRCARNP